METTFRKLVNSLNLHNKKRLDRSICCYSIRMTEKNKRVLRILKNILGEKGSDFRSD